MVGIRLWKIVALAASAIAASVTAGARDWYVAPGGVDGGAGTTNDPLATVAHAISRTSAGDSILLERGVGHRSRSFSITAVPRGIRDRLADGHPRRQLSRR